MSSIKSKLKASNNITLGDRTTASEKSELFHKLASISQPWKVVDFDIPNPNGEWENVKLTIRVLSDQLRTACIIAAREALQAKGLKREDITDSLLEDQVAREVLTKAVCEPNPQLTDSGKPIFVQVFNTSNELSTSLSTDTIVRLFNAYLLVQEHFGLDPKTQMVMSELEQFIDIIAEGANESFLYSLPGATLVALITTMAKHLKACMNTSLSQNLRDTTTDAPRVSLISKESILSTEQSSKTSKSSGTNSAVDPLVNLEPGVALNKHELKTSRTK